MLDGTGLVTRHPGNQWKEKLGLLFSCYPELCWSRSAGHWMLLMNVLQSVLVRSCQVPTLWPDPSHLIQMHKVPLWRLKPTEFLWATYKGPSVSARITSVKFRHKNYCLWRLVSNRTWTLVSHIEVQFGPPLQPNLDPSQDLTMSHCAVLLLVWYCHWRGYIGATLNPSCQRGTLSGAGI